MIPEASISIVFSALPNRPTPAARRFRGTTIARRGELERPDFDDRSRSFLLVGRPEHQTCECSGNDRLLGPLPPLANARDAQVVAAAFDPESSESGFDARTSARARSRRSPTPTAGQALNPVANQIAALTRPGLVLPFFRSSVLPARRHFASIR